jgi:hypothetical protein
VKEKRKTEEIFCGKSRLKGLNIAWAKNGVLGVNISIP